MGVSAIIGGEDEPASGHAGTLLGTRMREAIPQEITATDRKQP